MQLIGCRIAAAAAGIFLQLCAGRLGRFLYPLKWAWTLPVGCAAVWMGMSWAAQTCLKAAERHNEEDGMIAKAAGRVRLIWLGLLMNALVLGAALGMMIEHQYVCMAVNCTIGLLIGQPLFCFLLCWPSAAQPHGRKYELDAGTFSRIHGLLREEAKTIGYHGRIRLFLGDGGASSFAEPTYDGILISPLFLAVVTQNELRQVFRHELAHLVSEDARRELRWRRLDARGKHMRICMRHEVRLLAVQPLLAVSERFAGALEEVLKRTAPQREYEADAYAVSREEARHAVAAMAKAEFVDRFLAGNENLPRRMETIASAYHRTIAQKGKKWLEELEQTCPNDDPHPRFRERRMHLGVMHPNPYEKEQNAEWLCEMKRVFELTDRIMNPR